MKTTTTTTSTTSSSINATVASVRPYFKNEQYSLRVEFTEDVVPALTYDENGELVDTKVSSIYLPTSVILAQLCNADARFACWFSSRRDKAVGKDSHPFAPSVAEAVLVDAEFELKSTKHNAGDIYLDAGVEKTYRASGYNTEIVGVRFKADIDAALNKYIPKDRSAIIADLF